MAAKFLAAVFGLWGVHSHQSFFDYAGQQVSSHDRPSNDAQVLRFSDTSNLIFSSFSALLHQWPNTVFPNGHSIIPGTVPPGTLLYHGTNHDSPPPTKMEWLGFSPEVSYFTHAARDGPTALHTYSSTRPLKIIYLDGQSASVGTAGFMDSQSCLVNSTVPERLQEFGPVDVLKGEYRRAGGLCQLGKEVGFEGVVRMNTGFELLWCNFQTGLELVSSINTTDPFFLPPNAKQNNPAFDHKNTPFYSEAPWETSRIAALQYHDPGETRVKLDPTGFISFYDRIESLAQRRAVLGIENQRSKHRLVGISLADAHRIRERLRLVLRRKDHEGWATFRGGRPDWQGIVRNIIQRYERRLIDLAFLLRENHQNATVKAFHTRRLTYAMLMPYLDLSKFDSSNLDWISPSIEKCITAFTGQFKENLTESSNTLLGAIEGTLGKLCHTVSEVFGDVIQLALPVSYTDLQEYRPELEARAQVKVSKWGQDVNNLMSWLGWFSWSGCDPQCLPNEICMTPMWPASRLIWNRPFKRARPQGLAVDDFPAPECLKWKDSKPLSSLPKDICLDLRQPNFHF